MSKEAIKILYKNYRNETAWRKILPKKIQFKKTEYHPKEQWILTAWDYSRNAIRDFAMVDIIEWNYSDVIKPKEEPLIENGIAEFLDNDQCSELNGLLCCECNQPQYDTPSGATCGNDHGGASGYIDEPKEGLSGDVMKEVTKTVILKGIPSKESRMIHLPEGYLVDEINK